jgi:alkanesulfonate monooxygenase SsuD/methylene tetrahydromethanopterin reductase-like flavin-dependent oxidoreductase (luciferase family)
MQETRNTNPIFNTNEIKLGVFCINGEGSAKTRVPERFRLTWPNSIDVAMEADRGGFEAIVPYSRWGSLTHPTHATAFVFENFTWAAAVSAKTHYSSVMSTCQMTAAHPILAAKAMTTVDHISNGRFSVNLVTGWNPGDRKMFGVSHLPREEQYAYAEEWLTVVKRLWSEDEPVDYSGRFFQIEGGMSQPKPVQRPFPALMNAGGSSEGQAFVANHCNIAFVPALSAEVMKRNAAAYRKMVRETTGREIQVWIQAYVVQRDSIQEAEKYVDYYAVEHADEEHIDAVVGIRKTQLPPHEMRAFRRNQGASPGGRPLLGNADDIARQIAEISECGIDGVLMTWVDYHNGLRAFNSEVVPRLERLGLRQPKPAQ